MASGTNRVSVPVKAYDDDPVYGVAVQNNGTTIPSGSYIVGGRYYEWNDEGFTGKTFFTGIPGPTRNYNFSSDTDVIDYLNKLPEGSRNLNAVFEAWQRHIDELNAYNPDAAYRESRGFEDAVYEAGGVSCVHA